MDNLSNNNPISKLIQNRMKLANYENNNFEGIIKAGTPFVQIIPFKRDNWESESVIYDEGQLILSLSKPYKYRKNKVNYYRDHEWDKKQFR